MNLADFIAQWDLEAIPACEEGMKLLQQFAEKHPDVYQSLRPEDFIELNNPRLSDIPEWNAFAGHCSTCEDCNEI